MAAAATQSGAVVMSSRVLQVSVAGSYTWSTKSDTPPGMALAAASWDGKLLAYVRAAYHEYLIISN